MEAIPKHRHGGRLAKANQCLLCLVICFVGCAKAPPVSQSDDDASAASEIATAVDTRDRVAPTTSTPVATPNRLVGTWYGQASLDMGQVAKRLDGLETEAQKAEFQAMVEAFLATEMAVRFTHDGGLESEVRVLAPTGEVAAGTSTGSWKLLEATNDYVVIEMKERFQDGATSSSQARYQFESAGDKAVMVAGVDPRLADCRPVIVFERMPAAATADRGAAGEQR